MQAAQVTANLFPVELNVTELHRSFAAFMATQLNPLKCTALAFIVFDFDTVNIRNCCLGLAYRSEL